MIHRKNYHSNVMSDDYERLCKLLDDGYVVVCFVDYEYRTGGKNVKFRDVAKAKSNDYNPNSMNYGYVVEARGIVYINWDRNMKRLRDVTFSGLCSEINLQFIDA